MTVVEDSEPEETREKWTGMLADELRMVQLAPTISPFGSCPVMPGWGIAIPDSPEMSPRSIEGRQAAKTLEKEMGRRIMSQYMRPLTAGRAGSGSPVPKPDRPVMTPAMLEEAMRTIRQRHSRSPLAMTDQAVMFVARGLTQRTRGPSFPPSLTPRVVESLTHLLEETEVVDGDEPHRVPTNAGSKSGPAGGGAGG